MPSERDWRPRIADMIDAIEAVQAYTKDMTFDQFRANLQVVHAVLMNFIIIGEAAAHLPRDVTERYRDVPWSQMAGMRNVLVHGYWIVDLDVVWEAVQRELPPLLPRLREVLGP